MASLGFKSAKLNDAPPSTKMNNPKHCNKSLAKFWGLRYRLISVSENHIRTTLPITSEPLFVQARTRTIRLVDSFDKIIHTTLGN